MTRSRSGSLAVVPAAPAAPQPAGFRPRPEGTPVAELVAALYEHYRDLVYHLALRYGAGNHAWAEDRTQEVFLHLFDHAAEVNRMDRVGGWFYRVTTNRCLNRMRRDRFLALSPVRWVLGERGSRPVDPESLGIHNDLLKRAFARVNEMPPRERACFMMYHVDGKTQAEIGQILGHSKGYVSKLIARCERQIVELIDGDERGKPHE